MSKYMLILIAAVTACVAALVAAAFHRKIASSLLGGTKLWQILVVLAVCGFVVTVSYEIARQAWRHHSKANSP